MTGSVDTYLLMKEMENEDQTVEMPPEEENAEFDLTSDLDEG